MKLRIAILIILVSITNVFATPTYSQLTKISLSMQNTSLEKVMDEIEHQTEFYFIFNQKQIDVSRIISIQVENKLITDILPELFNRTNVNYVIIDRKILLTTDPIDNSLISESLKTYQLQQRITGKVTDINGNPLAGVTVLVKGTTYGALTDKDGEYVINNATRNSTIIFSFIGMITQEISVSDSIKIDVVMKEAAVGLDEVVVIGYGTVKKSDLTGSVTSLKSENLQTGALNSLDKQLSGKAAGVQVTQIDGGPGSGTTIRIRGTNSITGNNEPLFVVDNVPYGNDFSDINPNDILSVEILKDASSTAIYGSRGANGVVLITTKQGSLGQPKISFDTYYGIDILSKKLDMLNAEELAEIHRRAIANGVSQVYDPNTIHGPGTDWQNEIIRTAPTQNYQLALSGGTPNLTYFFSGNYLDKEGIVINTGSNRYALRANIKSKVNDKITMGINLYISKSLQKPTGSTIGDALLSNPIYPVKDVTGKYLMYTDPKEQTPNPVAEALLVTNDNNSNKILSNVFGEFSILKNLVAKVNLGTNMLNEKDNYFAPIEVVAGQENNIIATVNNSNSFYWVINNTVTYNKVFSENHKLEAMIGFTAEKNRTENVSATSKNFTTDYQLYNSLQSGQSQSASSSLYENQLASFLARLNYDFKDKYLVTISGRYDGSSRFGSANKWALFPSGAFAWKVSNEDFMKDFKSIISDLKLRASIGSSGEQAIPSYQTLPSLDVTSVLFANNTFNVGFTPSRLASPNLKWEKTTQYDFGVDAGFLEGRMNFSADFYYKKTTDLLYYKAIPQTTGYNNILSNIGSMENKGMEYNLSTVNTTGDFKWITDFNLSFNRNKILDLGLNPDGTKIKLIISPTGANTQYSYVTDKSALIVGKPIGGAYGTIYEGTYKSAEEVNNGNEPGKVPGDAKYADLNGDGVVNGEDRTLISNPNPDFIGGLTNKFSYKNFDLSIFLQFVVGNSLFDLSHYNFSLLDGVNNTESWALNSWSPENPTSNIPRAGWDVRTLGFSTFHVEDASFLRAKNITLSYNLHIKKWNVNTCKFYFSVDNAFTLTKYPGYNPDVSAYGNNTISSGFDQFMYPLARTFLFGLNLEF